MLAMADRRGRVWASVPGLANRARVPDDAVRAALLKFLSPDPDSRTKEYEGRRIEEIDGGWRLLNHEKYREIRDDEAIRESKRKYINRRRKAERVENVERSRTLSSQAEAEAEAEKKNGSFSPASQKLQGAALVVAQKEFDRVLMRMKEIRQSYDSHNEMSSEHRAELKSLSLRKSELKSQLGVAI